MSNNSLLSHKLANGLQIVGEYLSSANSCSIGVMVNTGSRDETVAESGISHFLEHMMFKGTFKRSAKEVNDCLGELGAQANAYTSVEHTTYYATILPEFQSGYLELLLDMLQPKLDSDEFDMEKKVILEEIARKNDDPSSFFYMETVADYFASHPLGNSVLGSVESVSAITVQQMRDYWERRYQTKNMVLSVAGNFDWEKICIEAEQLTANWKLRETARVYPELKFSSVQKDFKRDKLNMTHLLLVLPGPSAQDANYYPANLWANIIGDQTGSKIYWDLLEPGTVESCYLWVDANDQAGSILVYASCDPKNLEEVTKKVKSYLTAKLNFSEQELERSKTKLASRLAISAEMPYNRMINLSENFLYHGKTETIHETIAKVNAVQTKDIVSFLNNINFETFGEYRLIGE